MNIPKLKEAIKEYEYQIRNRISHDDNKEVVICKISDLKHLISVCQLLCDVSDKMLGKKEVEEDSIIEQMRGIGSDGAYENGYNLARSEDILWLTKKMMGIEDLIESSDLAKHAEHGLMELIGYSNPHRTTVENIKIDRKKALLKNIKDLADAIRQEMGVEK